MKKIIKSLMVLGFLVFCGFILLTPDHAIVEQQTIYPETLNAGPIILEDNFELNIIEEVPAEKITPVELSIESVNIKAPIELVGTLNGAMAVPTLPENVGWYEHGPLPGESGSAVLAGHVNWRDNPNAVFTNLKKVQVGDIIKVRNSDGEVITFLVKEIKSYPIYADTKEVFSSDDGLAHLNLITCDGLWNSIIKSHESRLVIFAVKFFES